MTGLKKWIVLYDAVRLSLKKRGKSEFSKSGGCCVPCTQTSTDQQKV